MKKQNVVLASIALFITSIMCMFVITARAVILPTVLSELGGMSYYSITVILSSMSMSMSMPIAGKLGDMFGRKRIYCIGAVGYTVALLMCGFAFNPYLFMAGIALTGVFYGFLYSQQMALTVDVYKSGDRPRFIGYFTVISGLACFLGPVVGGFCVDTIGWRWVFFITVPVALLNLITGFTGISKTQQRTESEALDYIGTALFIATVLPFLYALTCGGKTYAWISAPIIGMVVFSLVMGVLLIHHELRVENPIIPISLFKNTAFVIAILVTMASGFMFSMQNYLPIYYQAIRGFSATLSGVVTVPRQGGEMLLSFLIGLYLSRQENLRHRYRKGIIITVVSLMAAMFMMSRFNATTSLIVILICEIFYGCPLGSQGVLCQSLGTVSLDNKMMGSGLAFIGFASVLGNSLGAAITGCIINQYWDLSKVVPAEISSRLSAENMTALSSTSILRDTAGLAAIRNTLPENLFTLFDSTIEALKAAINRGMSVAYFTSFVLLILVTLAVVLVRWDKNIKTTTQQHDKHVPNSFFDGAVLGSAPKKG